jgi:hypothetical protein
MRLSPSLLLAAALAVALIRPLPARAESPPDPLAGAQALADRGFFEEAALSFEDRARALFGTADGARALGAAARIRLGLGQQQEAEVDAARLDQVYGEDHPDVVAGVTMARARHHAGLLEWDALRAVLAGGLPAIDRRTPIGVRLEAHALLGRALAHLGRRAEARAEYRRVRALATPEPGPGPGADALGEARFFLAEEVGEGAARVVLVPYDGAGDRATVMAYLQGPAVRWLKRKTEALEAAQRTYQRVLGGSDPEPPPPARSSAGGDPNAPIAPWEPAAEPDPLSDAGFLPPSPRWAVAAAARVGLAWGSFADDLRRLPIPREWDSPEIRAAYFSMVESLDETPLRRAKAACGACLSIAERAKIADEHTEACDAWLSRHYSFEHPALDELRPRPPALSGPPRSAPAPLGR